MSQPDQNSGSHDLPQSGSIQNADEEQPKKRSLFRKIINVFISIFLALILIIILIIGFSQTRTFRELLRTEVISLVNKETNGTITIGKIDGTILTSLFLRDVYVKINNDTLLQAGKIEIKTSPLQLLLKKIYIRKVLIEDVKIRLLQDQDGVWNLAKFIKPKPEDTTKSSFSFLIHVNDIQLHNISFVRQSYPNLNSTQNYDQLNPEDLRVDNLNFSAQAFADIEKSNYLLVIKELSLRPNLSRFNLKYISGEFAVTKNFASVKNFYFLTDSSEIGIDARLDSLNLFGKINLDEFKNYPISISARSKSFNFDDISSFIGATEILKGHPSIELKAHGKFGNFKIDKAKLDYGSTHFEFEGRIQNLNRPEKLFISAKISNSDVDYNDINALLPSLKLPEFAKLKVSDVSAEFEGEPVNFKSRFEGNVADGKLFCDVSMNLSSEPVEYNISFQTENLDLSPVINIPTKLYSKGTVVGKSFSPVNMSSDIRFTAEGSQIKGMDIDRLAFNSHSYDGTTNLKIDASSGKLGAYINGDVSFDKDTIPAYNLVGQIKNLDLSKFLKEEKYESNFNLYLSADGKSFNPDELTAAVRVGIDSSRFQGERISNSDIRCLITKDSTGRKITLASDYADLDIGGSFSLNKAIELVAYQSTTITDIITKKIGELNPLAIVEPKKAADSVSVPVPPVVDENILFNYSCTIKDLELISKLIGYERLDLLGVCKGYIKNEAGKFTVSSNLNLDYFVMMDKKSTIYLSGFKGNLNFTRDNHSLSFDKLFGTASITGKRFYSGSNIKAIEADVTFNQSKLFFSASANISDLFDAGAEGIILMTPREQKLLVDKLSLNYKGIEWTNRDSVKILFNPDYFKIVQCNIKRDTTLISLSGSIESSGKQDLSLNAAGISGDILERYLLGLTDDRLHVNGSAYAKIMGTLDNPLIDLSVQMKDFKLPNAPSGNFKGLVHYSGKNLTANLAFLDSTSNEEKPLISLFGTLPINLSFTGAEERFLQNNPLNIQIRSKHFNLSSLGQILPLISEQRGILTSDLNITGTFKSPVYSGFINLTDGDFKMRFNNLNYKCGMRLSFKDRSMSVDSMLVANNGGTNFPGIIYGTGGIDFDGFKTRNIKLIFNGDLAILGAPTQSVSPLFYGDLLIGSDGDWILSKNGDRIFFKGDILLKNTNLTYTTSEENNSGSNKNFNFIYVQDSSRIDKELVRFQQVLSKEKDLANYKEELETPINFDYEIGIKSENSAKAVVILSQAVNQKLFVEMNGGLKYSNISGETRAQGVFELLRGSKLDFIKTFEATGLLRFERDITDPYLDIIATYTDEYINPRDETGTPQEVAVKIKIRSPLSELGKSLAGNNESIGVYVGAKNIQNNVRDTRYDYADAFSFIFIGKFKDDLTAQDKTNVAGQTNLIGNTATSFLGSILSNFVNSAVGDLVNNIQINQTTYATKISLSGRTQNFRYTFGGTTDSFLNIGKANVKLEWSPLGPSFLLRVERKEPIVSTFGLEEKISELALKYKFEF